MRAPSRHFFQIAGSILVLSAPLMAQNAPIPAVAPRDTTTWTTFKGDPQGTNSTTANVKLPLSLQWRYSSDAISREFLTSPLVIGAPGHQVVAFGAGRNVIALDPQTGAQAWKSPDFTSEIVTPPTLLSGENGDLIIVAQSSGRVDALRTSDGGRVWEIDALSSITNAGPVIANTAKGKRIICALTAGRLIALNLDGSIDPDWTVPLGRYGITPTTAMTLSADGKLLYICGSDAKLYVIDLIKGGPAYTIQLSANSSVTPVIAGDLLVTANVRLVSGYKASGGANIWNFDPRGEVLGSPAVGTDATGKTMIYFGTRTGLFYGLDATGAQVWKADVGAGITGIPLVLPKMVIVGTSNGMLIGFDPANGAIIWQYRLKTERAIQQTNNNNGGGGFGGRRGGFGGGATANTATMQIWGVSAAPSAIDGQLFVLADNAALYSFTTAPFDAAPPRVIEPSIAVPNDQDTITSLLLSPQNPQIVPGRGPIYFATQLDDTGSGVDPKSISIIVDGLPVASDAVNFDIASGVLTVTLLDPKKGGTGFPDGLKNILLNASDYAGNKLEFNTTFNIDNTAASPSATQQTGRGGRGGFGGGGFGGGGFGGGGFGGGNPDGGGGVDGGDGNPDGGGNPFGGGGNPDGNGGGEGNPDGGNPDGGGQGGGELFGGQ